MERHLVKRPKASSQSSRNEFTFYLTISFTFKKEGHNKRESQGYLFSGNVSELLKYLFGFYT